MADLITWEQAYSNFEHNNERNIQKAKDLIEEIETSDFACFDAIDVHHFVSELNSLSQRKEPYTANEIREINLKANKDVNRFDFINSFIDDETDDIFDFF